MDSVPLSWYYSPHCRWLMSLFNSKGKLKRLLRNGEFPLFQHMPVFESEFMQVTKRGEVVSVHNRVHVTTVGITYSTPKLLLPDIMLLACPAVSCARCDQGSQGGAPRQQKA